MKILRLLSKKNFSIILILILCFTANAEDQPVDIWNIEQKEADDSSISNQSIITEESELESNSVSEIYSMQSKKKNDSIQLDETLINKEIKIYGLYDPEDYGLDINMWLNSNGNQIKDIFSRINKINLSEDASKIMEIALLTNAHPPKIDMSEKDFLDLKSKWLIKNSDLILIEEYLIKNQVIDLQPKLTRYLLDQYLSEANIDQACNIFSKNTKPIEDHYLSKFNIYSLIKSGKKMKHN